MDMFDGPYYLGNDSIRKEEYKTKVLTLLEQALCDEHWEVRGKGVATLSEFSGEHAFQLYARGFSDKHANVRERAADFAGRFDVIKAVSLLEKALADPAAKVRAAAADSLGKLGADTSVAPLLAALKEEKDYNAQTHILSALKSRFAKSPGVQEAIKVPPQIHKPAPKPVKPPKPPATNDAF
jgi:HEAT repeat protein